MIPTSRIGPEGSMPLAPVGQKRKSKYGLIMQPDAPSSEGFDIFWIASDSLQQVGMFATGGDGPIPWTARPWIYNAEEQALMLSVVCAVELKIPYPRPDDFMALAERGFFSFDWTDVHKPSIQATSAYEMVCRPASPLTVDQLPPSLRVAALATKIIGKTLDAGRVDRVALGS